MSPSPDKPRADVARPREHEVPGQPAGTKDRTFGNRTAFPRDVDEETDRTPKRDPEDTTRRPS